MTGHVRARSTYAGAKLGLCSNAPDNNALASRSASDPSPQIGARDSESNREL